MDIVDQALIKKLKFKSDLKSLILESPEGFKKTLGENIEEISSHKQDEYDWILIFVKNKVEFEKNFNENFPCLKNEGLFWIAFPKGISKIQTDLTRDKGWDIIEKYENVIWNSLISINGTWSGFAIKREDNPKKREKKLKKFNPEIEKFIDYEKRQVFLPDDVFKIFDENHGAKVLFDKMPFTHQKEYILAILEAKKPETRQKRIEAMLIQLLKYKKS